MTRLTKIILTTIWTIFALSVMGQNYEPTILILSPNKTTADKELKKEIREFNDKIKENQKQKKQELQRALKEMKARPENIKVIHQKQIEFSKCMDFYNTIPSLAEGYLQYRFFERFQNLLIYAINEKSSSNIEQLAAIADMHKMRYIINIPEVNSYIENNSKKTTIKVQMFDNHQKKILLNKEYTGEDRNPGFEFTCQDGSLSCTFNNSLSQALSDITTIVATNNPTIKHERELVKDRVDVLFSKYYPKEPEEEILDVISKIDTSISTAGFYHGFMNDNKTKFIGFFAISSQASNFQELRGKKDKNVQIISEDIHDLDNVPRIYANVILGINHNSKWYIKRDKVTYFNSDDFEAGKKEFFSNLQQWNFFNENSSEFNPQFWETYFFDKVKDLTKDPDWDKYGTNIWKREEEENREYIGQYEIVVEQLKKAKADSIEAHRVKAPLEIEK